ncbi:PREDICTED: WAP four-disulfide core domain protein 3 isoform X4 [Capra hircus]|uniref:WAP four-disulfide core domain protein 3 isoform X4 n=1 Tax=Capra hircus TaxID=9925 RepID=UPI00084702B3|nr:PREDICTED: WAP four-disulfide core domain protein 3 isoform X4 [Capra hircus]
MKLGGLFLLASLLTLNTRLQAMGVCEEQCREDPDCAAGEKCVSDGCGRVCSPAPQASICVNECREDRDCGIEKECLQVGCQRVCLPLATADVISTTMPPAVQVRNSPHHLGWQIHF